MLHRQFFKAAPEEIWAAFEDKIEALDRKRRKYLLTLCSIFFVWSGCAFIAWKFLDPAASPFDFFIPAWIATSIPLFYIYKTFRRAYRLDRKFLSHHIMIKMLGSAYRSHTSLPVKQITEHNLLPKVHSRLYQEDGYLLNIAGYRVIFQEIEAVKSLHRDSVRDHYEFPVARGIMIHLRLKRRLKSHTVLVSRARFPSFFSDPFLQDRKYAPVGLVSPEFSQKYQVYSTDQMEARLLFHPAFIEKFITLAENLSSSRIEVSALEDKILIFARYGYDRFQLGTLFKSVSYADLEALIDELEIYANIIDTLNLNPYTAP